MNKSRRTYLKLKIKFFTELDELDVNILHYVQFCKKINDIVVSLVETKSTIYRRLKKLEKNNFLIKPLNKIDFPYELHPEAKRLIQNYDDFPTIAGSQKKHKRIHYIRYFCSMLVFDENKIKSDFEKINQNTWHKYVKKINNVKVNIHFNTNKIFFDVPTKWATDKTKTAKILDKVYRDICLDLKNILLEKYDILTNEIKLSSFTHNAGTGFKGLEYCDNIQKKYIGKNGEELICMKDNSISQGEIEFIAKNEDSRNLSNESLDVLLDAAPSVVELKNLVVEMKEQYAVTFSGLTGQQIANALAMNAQTLKLMQNTLNCYGQKLNRLERKFNKGQ